MRNLIRGHISPGSAEAYAFATICIVLASLVRWILGLISPDILPFATFFPAILLAALVGGPGPGIFAATLGGVIGWWAFLAPQFALLPLAPHHQIDLLLYLFSALIIVWGADHYRRLASRLADEEALRRLSVEELSHRLKNKLATIQAILRLRLREHRQLSIDVIASLDALMATDNLIMQTQGQGARIRDILFAEVRPYEASRVIIDGPDVLLPPKLASVMALLVHELATNAAKYGALSSPAGAQTNLLACDPEWTPRMSVWHLADIPPAPAFVYETTGSRQARRRNLPPTRLF